MPSFAIRFRILAPIRASTRCPASVRDRWEPNSSPSLCATRLQALTYSLAVLSFLPPIPRQLRGQGISRSFSYARGRAEHRQLALLLKAAFNAVEAGIISPEQLFLAWLVGKDGRTIGDVALPRLPKLLAGGASQLLIGA